MKIFAVALFFVAFTNIHAYADSTTSEQAAINSVNDRFEVSAVLGLKEGYSPGEQIILYVQGNSPVQIVAEPKSGFHVQATVRTEDEKEKAFVGVNGQYDEEKQAWLLVLNAPSDPTTSYQMTIALYCATSTSPCVDVYGEAAQATKVIPLQILPQ